MTSEGPYEEQRCNSKLEVFHPGLKPDLCLLYLRSEIAYVHLAMLELKSHNTDFVIPYLRGEVDGEERRGEERDGEAQLEGV